MSDSEIEIVRQHCRPLAPRPTGAAPRLNALPDVAAVLFDIYGTLLASGAGDITLQTGTSSDSAFRDALVACQFPVEAVSQLSASLLQETIAEHHAAGRDRGISSPEVDIVEVWRDVLRRAADRFASIAIDPSGVDASRLAVEYEVRVNPVWPMPGLLECLAELRDDGFLLGIVSNAQAMTRDLFPALLGRTLDELGFSPNLQFFSYRFGESKPGRAMFDAAATSLKRQGIEAGNAVYVGNDMLNDVWAAARVGFQTVLFAGDERSLRLRADDERVRGCTPDSVVTNLSSISACLGRKDRD